MSNSLLFQTDVMFEICAELGLYPSKYQRGNMMVRSLYLSCFAEFKYLILRISLKKSCIFKFKLSRVIQSEIQSY